jgi:hypothetical protein
MATEKQNIQKKVLDALKDELQPLSDAMNESLTGGFVSTNELLKNADVPNSENESEDATNICQANMRPCGTNNVAGCNLSSKDA